MTRMDEHEIERRLADDRGPEPPADLAERIKAEIPEELPSFTAEPEGVSPLRPRFGRRLLLAAAGLVLVAGSGAIAWRVLQHGPGLEMGTAYTADSTHAEESGKGEASARSTSRPSSTEEGEAEQKAPPTAPLAAVAESVNAPAEARRASAEKAQVVADSAVEGIAGEGAEPVPAGLAAAARAEARATSAKPAGVCEVVTVRVIDETGGGLPGVTVTLSRMDALEVAARTAVTNAGGLAAFRRVPEGSYRLEASMSGFSSARIDQLSIVAGSARTIDLRLVAAYAEEIMVADASATEPELVRGREGDESRQAPSAASKIEVTAGLPVIESKKGQEAGVHYRMAQRAAVSPAFVPPSTGGTAEPNDRPYGDVFFEHSGVNPFIDTEDDNLSTFGLDVDTGSYTVARRYLADGNLPDPASVRVEEWVNYFHYGDKAPRRGDFAVTAEAAPTPFGESDRYRIVRFGIRARDIDDSRRKPAALTFVVDVSGSMAREDRLGLVKRALFALLDQLKPSDEVALVVYGSRGRVLLEPTADKEKVRSAIDRLRPGGSTNAEEGLVLAYDLASEAFRRGGINRVILCSDGVANVGRTGPESILARIEREASRGIELTTVGFGMGNYNDVLMEQLADKGNGRYAYVDTFKEARRIFVENLTGTLQTIAVNAKVQVEFNPKVVSRYRLLGYENRDIADDKFRDDTVDAGEIGAGHTVTALYEVKLQGRPARGEPLATLHLRYRPEEGKEFVETAHRLTLGDVASSWEQASPSLKLAALVAETAEILKGSYWAKDGDLSDVFRRAQRLSPSFPGDADVAEFVALVGNAARLKAPVATPVALPEEDR